MKWGELGSPPLHHFWQIKNFFAVSFLRNIFKSLQACNSVYYSSIRIGYWPHLLKQCRVCQRQRELNTIKFNKYFNITSRFVLTLTRKQTLFVALSLNGTRSYLLREGVQKTLLRGHVPYQGGGALSLKKSRLFSDKM